jgi:hypothetical protein
VAQPESDRFRYHTSAMFLTGHHDTASNAKDLRFGDNTIAADVNTTRKNFKVEIDRFVLSVIPRP